jgi:hypothetical protein
VPSARELLEQADALMRKNRGRIDGDIPVLTDAVAATPTPLSVAAAVADFPVLTERVEDVVAAIPPLPGSRATVASVFEGDPSDWLVMDTIDPAVHSITGKGPDTLAVVPPVTLKTPDPAPEPPPFELDLPTRATHKAAGSAPTPPPARSSTPESVPPPAADEYLVLAAAEYSLPLEPGPPVAIMAEVVDADPRTASDERWRALAEQISMQVLQRIDLFTDTGLKEQLALHLQPIVDRASAELVGEINDQVGKLVRSYVAEAIEREIAQWRSDHH